MRYILSLLLVLVGAGTALTACACDGPKASVAAADVAVADLKAAIAAKTVVLLDANGSASYAKGRLPGAIDFEARKAELVKALPADKGALIVAYCGGPKCGAWKEAAEAVAKLGYTNVKHFSGGLKGWKDAGEQLEATPQ